VHADDVTFRNVDLNVSQSGCQIGTGHGFSIADSDGFTFTNGRIDGNGDKMFFLYSGVDNVTVEKSELTGFQDIVFAGGADGCGGPSPGCGVGDILLQYNYVHDLDGFSWTSDPHHDLLQNGAWGPNETWTVRGNYVGPTGVAHPLCKLNAPFFGGDGGETLLFENNYMFGWGFFNVRWYGRGDYPGSQFVMRYNVYDVEHKTLMPGGNCIADAVLYESADSLGTYRCNRYSDGDFIEQQYVNNQGAGTLTHDTAGCPSYP
jgi:hypothetical protein